MEFWPKNKGARPEKVAMSEAVNDDARVAAGLESKQVTGDFDKASTPEEFIQSVDFNAINSIFDSLIKKAGGADRVNVSGHDVSPTRISFDVSDNGEGFYVTAGEAKVYSGEIALEWPSTVQQSRAQRNISLLKSLLHESAHIRGAYTEQLERMEGGEISEATVRHGLWERHVTNTGTDSQTALSLNEAVTEDIAHEVLREYLIRTGNSSYLTDPAILERLAMGAYVNDRLALSVIIQVIANETKVDKDQVWKGIVRAYMSGNDDLHKLFSDIETTIQENPRAQDVLTMLKSDTRIDHYLPINSLYSVVDDPLEQLEVMKRVIKSFDSEQYRNVLGLH
ncbi:MAG: hypothetical protein JWN64_40 [Parcubacteria group bacterium]|nr:hypothetical protein [Parcubacteria group bacterium]